MGGIMLNNEEYLRWRRQIDIPQFGIEAQTKLKESRIAVLGVGAVGGTAALYLAAAGIGSMIIADRDVVELSNLNRQILFKDRDIGCHKAELTAQRLLELNPYMKVDAVVQDIGEKEIGLLIEGCCFVLCCFDKNHSRFPVNSECVRRNIPAVYGFVQNFSGEIITVFPKQSACISCIMDENFPEPEETPVLGVASGIIGIAMASAAIRYITGVGDLMEGYRLMYDLAFPEFIKVPLGRNSACPVCGR